ncbi:MAG TPA: Uma2 family endonuclease [Chloroflexota bacterium]|nr:Uma2 family endonuclease [Chloroflexota bacterium]
MMRASPAAAHPALVWPPDDTEESVVGTDRHQMTIMNMRWGINKIAHAAVAPGQPVPFQALSQTMIIGFSRPDGTRYTTLPDVFVYPHPIAQDRGSLTLALDGPPVLIIEVASESTYDSDLDLERGKGWTYARAGVREYLVIDPTGLYLPEQIRAWRLEAGAYQPWLPDERGYWQSRELPIAIAVEEGLAAIYSSAGRRQPREGEIATSLDQMAEELARKDAEIAELRRRLEQTEREQR